MIEAAIFDYGRTLHDPETDQLFPGCEAILISLKDSGIKLALVSRGQDTDKRRQDFERFNLPEFFQVLDIIGEGAKKEFSHILEKLGVKPENTIVVGDRVKSEILEGNKMGTITIWFRNGKFADELPEIPDEQPDYTIRSLDEILSIIKQLDQVVL